MNKEFIPIELEKELFELGLEHRVGVCKIYKGIPVKEVVEDWYVGILYQQAFRWFREKYDLHVSFGRLYDNAQTKKYTIDAYNEICSYEIDYDGGYSTYEEAELACLKKLIEIAKNK